jgi:hypothetical protein
VVVIYYRLIYDNPIEFYCSNSKSFTGLGWNFVSRQSRMEWTCVVIAVIRLISIKSVKNLIYFNNDNRTLFISSSANMNSSRIFQEVQTRFEL